eukprot:6191413-Pyramimonas_sp.AAC.1
MTIATAILLPMVNVSSMATATLVRMDMITLRMTTMTEVMTIRIMLALLMRWRGASMMMVTSVLMSMTAVPATSRMPMLKMRAAMGRPTSKEVGQRVSRRIAA